MRICAALLLFLAACSTTVRDLPPDRAPDGNAAMLAGRMEFAGTKIQPTLRLRSLDGKKIVVKPKHATFLVALPPGTYRLERFGKYEPSLDKITLEAEAGEARYIGTFRAWRDPLGDLKVLVSDDMWPVAEELVDRYGPELPQMEPGLVRSELPPVDGALAIAVRPVPSSNIPIYVSFGLGFGYGFYGGGHKHYRPPSSGNRPSHHSRRSGRR